MNSTRSTDVHMTRHTSRVLSGSMSALALMIVPALATALPTARPSAILMPNASLQTRVSQSDISSIVNDAAQAVVGPRGMKRLTDFGNLDSGWDGANGRRLDIHSVERFSHFFAETNFCPNDACIFMSRDGNVVVNWLDPASAGQDIIELEFCVDGIDYFIEASGEEGSVPFEPYGFQLLVEHINRHMAGLVEYHALYMSADTAPVSTLAVAA